MFFEDGQYHGKAEDDEENGKEEEEVLQWSGFMVGVSMFNSNQVLT